MDTHTKGDCEPRRTEVSASRMVGKLDSRPGLPRCTTSARRVPGHAGPSAPSRPRSSRSHRCRQMTAAPAVCACMPHSTEPGHHGGAARHRTSAVAYIRTRTLRITDAEAIHRHPVRWAEPYEDFDPPIPAITAHLASSTNAILHGIRSPASHKARPWHHVHTSIQCSVDAQAEMPRSHGRLEDADSLRLRRQYAGAPERACHCIVHAAVGAAPAGTHVLICHQSTPPLAPLRVGPQFLEQWNEAISWQNGTIQSDWRPVKMSRTPSACLWPNLGQRGVCLTLA